MSKTILTNGTISLFKLEDKFRHAAEELCYALIKNQVNLGVTDLESIRGYLINILKHVAKKHGEITIGQITYGQYNHNLEEKPVETFVVFSGKESRI